MATLSLGNKTIFTQTGSADPVMDSGVNVKNAFTSLDTSASQGPTTDLTNTTLPIFACRAWVNFNSTDLTTVGAESHCTIRASGNVSKVVWIGTGSYRIYFSTNMPDSNYSFCGTTGWQGGVQPSCLVGTAHDGLYTNYCVVYSITNNNDTVYDLPQVMCHFFR